MRVSARHRGKLLGSFREASINAVLFLLAQICMGTGYFYEKNVHGSKPGLYLAEPAEPAISQEIWWALQDLNLQPTDYESAALTIELRARAYRLA